MEILGGGQLRDRAVAGGGLADVGVVLPVLTQHHAPVSVLERGMKWKSVIYHI